MNEKISVNTFTTMYATSLPYNGFNVSGDYEMSMANTKY
jgi:hypothetical protein